MSNLNDKPLSYGNLSRFYDKLKTNKLNTLESSLEGKQNVLTAGNNITIESNTISATDTTYTAGENIIINEGVIKADGYVYDASLEAISLPGYYKQKVAIKETEGEPDYAYFLCANNSDFASYSYLNCEIYNNDNIKIGTITSYAPYDSEFILVNITFNDGFEPVLNNYIYHLNIPYHTLQNPNEVGLAGFTKSHTSNSDSGKTLLAVGLNERYYDENDGTNALEVMGNGDLYIKGIGGYQGTTLTSKKTLQEVISAKQDALTAGTGISISDSTISVNNINDTTPSATSVYSSSKVNELLGDKANKVDYIVPMTLDAETYEFVPDYSVLNSATTDGSYTLKYVFTESNVDTTVAYGNLQVSQGGMLQTIHYFNGKLTYTMRMNESDQWMTVQENIIPCIWQSNIAKDISSYSAEKVDELIASLEARIAALEGA